MHGVDARADTACLVRLPPLADGADAAVTITRRAGLGYHKRTVCGLKNASSRLLVGWPNLQHVLENQRERFQHEERGSPTSMLFSFLVWRSSKAKAERIPVLLLYRRNTGRSRVLLFVPKGLTTAQKCKPMLLALRHWSFTSGDGASAFNDGVLQLQLVYVELHMGWSEMGQYPGWILSAATRHMYVLACRRR